MRGSGPPTSGRIFISYRREDTRHLVGRLSDRLMDHFGDDRVFVDVDTIEPGLDFSDAIATALDSCQVLLALVGDRWLGTTDPTGQRRLDDPNDLVRLELESALKRNIRVIPVLVDGITMPNASELPPGLAGLARRHAFEMSYSRFRDDARRLVQLLDRLLPAVDPASAAATRPAATPREQLAGRQQNTGGKAELYRAFWARFLDRVHAEHPSWTRAKIPQADNWINMPSGIKGAVYGSNFAAGSRIRTELYIDGGDLQPNLELFRSYRTRRQ